ncbi:AraC family transcriptional regulator [Sphingobacterium allocomposti]|uniref:AraC family transcriptional regulator n=1 Tax=Sphingobacterium allocomposti TaxID=415956 RepID=A0A5S5CWW4_9SPHI|nr:AraC family transcriptional regulator [Sphingobacterium composti Yoo et al. 2007 non Ten et al. 2007]TYP87012.1 AraC family transcriptional regulator [Sphingobacterium composti Yoo et al. 2007 non Ten et al. 2007]
MSQINTFAAFYAFSSGALILLGAMLLFKPDKTNSRANRWLGLFYVILACTFAQLFLEEFGIGGSFLVHLLELPRWAMFPCLFMAVRHYTSPSSSVKDWIFHFVPFLLFLLFSIVYLMPVLFDYENRIPQLPHWMRFTIRYFFFVQIVFYWVVCFSLFRRHQKNIRKLASFTEKIDLVWLKYLLISVLLLILIRLWGLSNIHSASFTPILYFFGVIPLAYSTLTQKSIYSVELYQQPDDTEISTKREPHERLTAEQVTALRDIVLTDTVSKKIYLDPTLTLSALSAQLGINAHELSYVLNNGLGKNFYQFINELRTEEAKVLLLSDNTKHLDMLGVAIMAGFNSKTTFYTTFKKTTGLTPKEYIRANSKETGTK